MPPKPKFTKEEIMLVAHELLIEKGIENVSARNIAKRLNCATSPIFTIFRSLEDIKIELYKDIKESFIKNIQECVNYDIPFKEFGLRWVIYVKEHENEFRFVYSGIYPDLFSQFIESFKKLREELLKNVQQSFGLSYIEAKEVHDCLALQVEGMIAQLLTKKTNYEKEEILHILGQTCLGIVNLLKLKNNTFDENVARIMAQNCDREPIKIK